MRNVVTLALALGIVGCSESTTTPVDDGGSMDAAESDGGGVTADGATPGDDGATPGDDGGPITGPCPGAQVRCGAACVDVSTDTAHCGGCDAACGAGEACVAGTCGGTASCPAGTIDCGGECRDASADPDFCGSCTFAPCASDQACVDGACACRPGLTDCGGACVDTTSSPDHCGGCDMPCDQVCTDGVCGPRMACPTDVCMGACVDTETDPLSCGGCGDACAVDQVCLAGNCEDYEPAPGCASCDGCDTCPPDAFCCDVPGYGPSCLDPGAACP